MLALIRKYRELLALLALLTVAGLTFLARKKSQDRQNPVDRAVIWVTSPLERAVSWTVGGSIDLVQSYVALRHLRQDNLRLRQSVLELQGEVASLHQAAEENDRLRALLDFGKGQPLRLLPAAVVGDSLAPGALSRVVRLGVGLDQGVRRGMAVVSATGVVGRVQATFGQSCDVQLLVDPESAVAARVERSRARATVAGTGSDRHCNLEFALRSDDIEEGDALVTSGTDGVFPAGLPVGKVVGLKRKTSGMFLRAQVAPTVDVRRLEDVAVVLGQLAGPDAPAASK